MNENISEEDPPPWVGVQKKLFLEAGNDAWMRN